MAKDVAIKVSVDTKRAVKSVGDLNEEIKSIGGNVEQLSEENIQLNDKLSQMGDNFKKLQGDSSKSLKGISSGFKGVGLAIKATGIGLLLGLFSALKRVLEGQQPVLDLVETTFTAIGLAIGAVVKVLKDVFTTQSEANGGFDATTKVIKNLMTIALAPLRLAFLAIKAALLGAQLAWENSWFGEGDPATIKELKDELSLVGDEVIELGKTVVEAAGTVIDNFGEMTDEVGGLVKGVVKGISEIDAAQIISDAAATTRAKNRAKIAEAVNKGILEQYDRLAEKDRQTRDDFTVSIEDRIAANDNLGKNLEEQEKLMLANAKISVSAAAMELKANDTVENRVALINAKNEVSAVEATIEGFKSEQLINKINLEKELAVIEQTSIDRTITRSTEAAKFSQEYVDGIFEQLEVEKVNLENEKKIELERLQNIINSSTKGTQARVDAEQDYLDAKQGFLQDEKTLADAKQAQIEKDVVTESNTKLSAAKFNAKQKEIITSEELDNILQLTLDNLDKQMKAELANTELTEIEKEAIREKYRQAAVLKTDETNLAKNETAMLNMTAQEQALVDASFEIAKAGIDAISEIQARRNAERMTQISDEHNFATQALKGELANRTITQKEYDSKVALLNQQKAQKELAAKRKAFKQEKAMAIVSTAMSTGQAVMAGLTIPGPVGWIAAALAAATGAIQIGLISSKKFKAARGGVVPGSASNVDSVDAMLAPGEAVINSNSTAMFPQLLSQINQAGGGISLAPDVQTGASQEPVYNQNQTQTVKAYVVESEMTDKQKSVSSIERSVSFG